MAKRIPKWAEELQKRIDTGEGYQYGNEGKKATWRADYLKDLPTKQYGRSYDDKLESFVRSMGGDEREARQFRTWMNQRESGELEKQQKYEEHQTKINRQAEENKRNEELNKGMKHTLKSVNGKPVYENASDRALSALLNNDTARNAVMRVGRNAQDLKDWDWNEFAQGAVRGTNKLTFGIGDAVAHDMNKNEWFNEDTRGWINEALRPADSTGQKIADGVTSLGGLLAPASASYKAADTIFDTINGLSRMPKELRNLTKGARLSNPSRVSLADEVQRGTGAGLLFGLGNEAMNAEDVNLRDTALRLSAEMAIGGVADGAFTAWRLWRQGRNVSEIANQVNAPEDEVAEAIRRIEEQTAQFDGTNPINREASGTVIDPNAPRLTGPTADDPIQQVTGPAEDTLRLGDAPLELNAPLTRRTPRGVGQEVQIDGTPQLEAPRPQSSVTEDELLDEFTRVQDEIATSRQAYVDERMRDVDAQMEQFLQGEDQWRLIQESNQRRKEVVQALGGQNKIYIDPRINSDWKDRLPKALRAAKPGQGKMDMYQAAETLGYPGDNTGVEQMLNDLDNLYSGIGTKKRDVVPEGSVLSPKQYEEHLNALNKEFENSTQYKDLDALLEELANIGKQNETIMKEQVQTTGEPLRFAREKLFRVDEEMPESFTRQMDHPDLVTQRMEGNVNTAPTNAGINVETRPNDPLEDLVFRRQEEPLEFRTQAERPRAKVDDYVGQGRPRTEEPRPTQTQQRSSDFDPLGVNAGTIDTAQHSPVASPKTWKDSVRSGDSSLGDTVQKFQEDFISDVQVAKDVEKEIQKMDTTGKLEKTAIGDVAYKDSWFKGLRNVRRAQAAAKDSVDQSYGKMVKYLRKNGISYKDFDEYALAVHARDIMRDNNVLSLRAVEIENRLESGTLNPEEYDTLAKQLEELEPYRLPKQATPEFVESTIKKWQGNKVMEDTRKYFVEEQRKDLDRLVEAGIYSKETAQKMKDAHANYISMSRAVDESSRILGVNSNITKSRKHIQKRGKGSEDQINSPIGSALRNRYLTIANAEKNKAMQKVKKFAEIDTQGNYFRKINHHAEDVSKLNTVKFFDKGEEVYYEVAPSIKRMVENLDNQSSQNLAKTIMQGTNSLVRKGATQFNVEFILRSIFRDPQTALVTSRTGMNPFDLAGAWLDSVAGKNIEKLTKGKFKSYADVYKEKGGDYSGFISMDNQSINKAAKAMQSGKLKDGFKVMNPFEHIGTFSQVVEHVPKLAEFRAAKRRGLSDDDAMFEAVDVIDYSDAGAFTRKANKYVSFLNAAIRGNTRLLQAFTENPKQAGKALTKAVTYITLPTVGIYAMRFAPGVSDDQRSKLRNLKGYEKNMFWHIPDIREGNETIYAFPKAHVLAQVFANPVERILEGVYEDRPDAMDGVFKDLSKSLMPPTGIPMVESIYEVMANRDIFLDIPIESETEFRGVRPSERHNEYTSELAKALGGLLPDDANMSPAKIDHFIKSLTGSVGGQVLDGADRALDGLGIVDRPLKPSGEEPIPWVPIDNPFIRPDARGSGLVDGLYDRQQELSYDGDKNANLDKVIKELKEISKEIREVRKDKEMTPAQKKRDIEALREQERRVADQNRQLLGN